MRKKLFFVVLIVLLYFKVAKGAIFMQNPQFQCYGITNEYDLKGAIAIITSLYNKGANLKDLYDNLNEIASAESGYGSIIYPENRGFGYGVFQFDKVAFADIKSRITANDSLIFSTITQRNINTITYDDLKTQILTATFFARAYLFYKIPQKIGKTINERAKQWKQYYNTYQGKGTEQGYITKANLYYYGVV